MERSLNPASRVLVTGATGFLGAWVVDRLLAEGIRATALGRNAAKGRELEARGARFVSCDLSDREGVSAAVSGHTHVVHAGALSSVWGRYRDFYDANVTGTDNVVRACLEHGAGRLVHISTPGIYIEPRDRLGIREDEPLPARQVNHYAATKLLGEGKVQEGVQQGLSAIILRPQGIFGPGDTAILPRLIRVARKGFFPVIRSEEVLTDLTAVENVVEAIFRALVADASLSGRAYNITNGEPARNLEMIDQVLGGLGIRYRRKHLSFRKAWAVASALEGVHRYALTWKEPLLTRHAVCALGFSRTLDIGAARRELGYRPGISVQEALEKVIPWYRDSAS